MRRVYSDLGRPVPVEAIPECFLHTAKRMYRAYVPRPIAGRLILFRAGDDGWDSTWGWAGLAGKGLEVYNQPADHLEMLKEPYVHQVAETMSRHLDEARTARIVSDGGVSVPTKKSC